MEMKEIQSLEQIEQMPLEEMETRMRCLCEKYIIVIRGDHSPGYMHGQIFVAPVNIPYKADYSKLAEATSLPHFALELILEFTKRMLMDETSDTLEQEFYLEYTPLLKAVASNQEASGAVLDVIAEQLLLCDEEIGEDEKIAVIVIKHRNCLPEINAKLLTAGWKCCRKGFTEAGCELISAIVRDPRISLEALVAFRKAVINEVGEPKLVGSEEEADEDDVVASGRYVLEIIDKVLLSRGYIKEEEASAEGYPYRQMRIFKGQIFA
jgi:hypothetical protein